MGVALFLVVVIGLGVAAFAISWQVGLLYLVIVGVLFAWASSTAQAEMERAKAGAPKAATRRSGPRRYRNKNSGYTPPKPRGVPTAPWSTRSETVEIVGEYYYQGNIQDVYAGENVEIVEGEYAVMTHDAVLVPAPDNPHGEGRAVAVYVDGHHVGYLPHEMTAEYYPPIAERTAAGEAVTVPGRQRARARSGDRSMGAWFSVRLPDPDGFAPPPTLPDGLFELLPAGGSVQVTREDQHMDVLGKHVRDDGRPATVAAILRMITEERPRSSVELVEVQIGFERVGVLTPAQSARLKPLVEAVAAKGLVPVARAEVRGNTSKADVVLFVAKGEPEFADVRGETPGKV